MSRHLAFFALALTSSAYAIDADPRFTEAERISQAFSQQLLATVKDAMAASGTENAIAVCQVAAPNIASQYSQAPWQIARTSSKLRNTNNAPDAWEQSVLAAFAREIAANPDKKPTPRTHISDSEYRYMAPIMVAAPCLACHGSALSTNTQKALNQRYPDDQATGYQLGELRGAITLRQRSSFTNQH